MQSAEGALTCQRIYEIAGDVIGDLPVYEEEADPQYPDDPPRCTWAATRPGRSMTVGQDPYPAEEATFEKLSERFSGDLPSYTVFLTDRLSVINAIAVEEEDNDTVDEMGSTAIVRVFASNMEITVLCWTSEAALEVATRIAEEVTQ